jgi:hypothetical protein
MVADRAFNGAVLARARVSKAPFDGQYSLRPLSGEQENLAYEKAQRQ